MVVFTFLLFTGLFSSAAAQNCSNPEGVNAMAAALAVAVMNETGRLDPINDLQISGDRISLTSDGLAQCSANGKPGCPNISAVLLMQDDAVNQSIPTSTFNASIFRSRMVSWYQRQETASNRPETDVNRAWAYPHDLELDSISSSSACGLHYWYDAVREGTQAALQSPEQLCTQLIWAGAQGTVSLDQCVSENPYLDFRYISTPSVSQVAVDPLPDVVNLDGDGVDPSSTLQACLYASNVDMSAQPCSCTDANWNTYTGVLMPVYTLDGVYFCQANESLTLAE